MPDINNIIDFINEEQKNNNDFERCKYLILFDEIFTIIQKNKNNYNTLRKITSFLAQLRKRGIIFISTAQIWSEIPIEYRRLCRYQISCHMFNVPLVNRAFLFNDVNDGYNAKWDNDSQDFVAPRLSTNFMKGNTSIINAYDTYEVIEYKPDKEGTTKVKAFK